MIKKHYLFLAQLFLLLNISATNAQEKINLDEDWKFHFGNASNPDKDFGYGTKLLFHKSNVFETTIVSPKFVDTTRLGGCTSFCKIINSRNGFSWL
jgi:beta-galactosidase